MNDNGSLSLSVTLPLDGFLPWSKKADAVSAAKDSIANYELQIADKKTSLAVSAQSGLKKIEQSISAIQSLKASVAPHCDLATKPVCCHWHVCSSSTM